MIPMKYLALLRGINVGGNNIVRMSDLRACLESAGCRRVATYIQSGNVLFSSSLKSTQGVVAMIETALSETLVPKAQAVVVSEPHLEQVVKEAPAAFAEGASEYRRDVLFLKEHLRAEDLLPTIHLKPGVDQAFVANGVLYFMRLVARASQSYLPKVINLPAYKSMTVRNWATTTKLYDLMQEL